MKSATARGPLCVSTSSPMRKRSIGCMPLGVATSVPSLKHLPPLLMVPAEASAPRMNDTGPDASPPLPSCSLEERMVDRLMPDPDPPLKIMPSSTYQLRIDGMVSSTDRMKQADACGSGSTPTLNQTGELKAAFWLTSRWVSSDWNDSASAS